MSAHSPTSSRLPRLNPFAFPSDTSFRFALLVVLVFAASTSMYSNLSFVFSTENLKDIAGCALEAIRAHGIDVHALTQRDIGEKLLTADFMSGVAPCMESFFESQGPWMINGVALLLVVAGAIYWTFPAWIIRRRGLVLLGAEDAPEVLAYLANLCHEAGLSRHPRFMWNPLKPTSTALAFGRFARCYVALSGGLVSQFYTDQPGFRAIVLHELAHLRNADVNKTYLTVALWWAFVVTALVPCVAGLLWRTLFSRDIVSSYVFGFAWRGFALTALVYLTRNAVLRTRELYADVRASVWEGPCGRLGQILEALPRIQGGWWRRLWHVHPDPGERRRAVVDTSRLFHLSFWDALAIGIAYRALVPSLSFFIQFALIGTLFSASPDAREQALGMMSVLPQVTAIGSVFLVSLVAGAVGLGVWRATFAALMRGETPRDAGRLGIGLALGLLLGDIQSLPGSVPAPESFFHIAASMPKHPAFFYGSKLLLSALLMASLVLLFKWVAAGASAWLEIALNSRSPRPVYTVGLILAALLCALGLTVLYLISGIINLSAMLSSTEDVLSSTRVFGVGLVVGLLAPNLSSVTFSESAPWIGGMGAGALPLVFPLAYLSLWAFPLAAWVWRRRTAVGTSWAFLEASARQFELPHQAPLRPGLALSIGLSGGLIFCVMLSVIHLKVPIEVVEALGGIRLRTIYHTGSAELSVFIGQIALAALMQAGIAAIAAGWIRRLGALHGLFSAFAAGLVMTIGIIGRYLLHGGELDLTIVLMTLYQVVSGGALLVLPIALGVSVVINWIHRISMRF